MGFRLDVPQANHVVDQLRFSSIFNIFFFIILAIANFFNLFIVVVFLFICFIRYSQFND